MDAKSVWPGFDYAHTFAISRGVEYYANANRVKAIAVFDKVLPGNNRKTTYVKVQFLDPNTGEVIEKEHRNDVTYRWEVVDEVRARELFMRWDEYEDETAHRDKERLEREARLAEERRIRDQEWQERQDRIRREREEEQAKAAAEAAERNRLRDAERQKILSALAVRGIATSNIVIEDGAVIIPKDVMLRWLGVAA